MTSHNSQEISGGPSGENRLNSNRRLDALIAEARNGSIDAMNRLIEAVSLHLWTELNSRERRTGTGVSRGSSDLLQETMVRLRERFDRFDRDTYADFKQWARAIRNNLGRESVRNRKARHSERHLRRIWNVLMERKQSDPELAPAPSTLERREEVERAYSCFQSLRPNERFVIELRLFKGMTHGKIAEMIGSTEDAVHKAYHRALKKLHARYHSDDQR